MTRHLFGVLAMVLLLGAQWAFFRQVAGVERWRSAGARWWLKTAQICFALVTLLDSAMRSVSFSCCGSSEFFAWCDALVYTGSFLAACYALVLAGTRWLMPRAESEAVDARSAGGLTRRQLLQTANGALYPAPLALTAYGILTRTNIRPVEVSIPIKGLPKDLHGLRIVQLSDIHLSVYLGEREFAPAIGIANSYRPHLVVVTGDLISRAGDPLDACLGLLKGLKADAGVYGCMGNHEIYAGAEEYVERNGARLGMQFLRQRAERLRFGQATLNLAGVDYQRKGKPYLSGVEHLHAAGESTYNLLLSHNPDVFPTARRKGFPLTLGGHTHGGQVRTEILHDTINVARFFTPYIAGLYSEEDAAVYVSQGIGTIGLPFRLGTFPEVGVLTLCAI